jgi:hypothetical protein
VRFPTFGEEEHLPELLLLVLLGLVGPYFLRTCFIAEKLWRWCCGRCGRKVPKTELAACTQHAYELGYHTVLLVQEIYAVFLLDDDQFSESSLFIIFVSFPFAEFVLKKVSDRVIPGKYDDIVIAIALELAQALLFSYFSDFNASAVAFFGYVCIVKSIADFIVFSQQNQDTLAEDSLELELKGCAPFFADLFAEAPVFIVQTLSVATLQAVWVILEVKLDRWEEIFITLLTWFLGMHLLVLEWETGFKKIMEFFALLGNIFNFLMLFYTAFFLADQWLTWLHVFGEIELLAFAMYDIYMAFAVAITIWSFGAGCMGCLSCLQRDEPLLKRQKTRTARGIGPESLPVSGLLTLLFTLLHIYLRLYFFNTGPVQPELHYSTVRLVLLALPLPVCMIVYGFRSCIKGIAPDAPPDVEASQGPSLFGRLLVLLRLRRAPEPYESLQDEAEALKAAIAKRDEQIKQLSARASQKSMFADTRMI